MHKRRVSARALSGDEEVHVCQCCFDAFRGKSPKLSKVCLANWLWLGRHPPIFRDSTLGHQLLLALGRVVSTKVYLSSKGKDEAVRQAPLTWRQKFLQSGMQGTAIVFGNGSVDDAMRSFPPDDDVFQETFAAVFTGPEHPTPEEERILQSTTEEGRLSRERMAREALRRERELEVEKAVFDEQARILQAPNYVYNQANYRTALVEGLPDVRGVPKVFEACAKFVAVNREISDMTVAGGPASATTTGQQERNAAAENDDDTTAVGHWMSVLDMISRKPLR